ncbi:hypothetical protein BDR06DRAFT_1002236 [Suillus hirtellus]|nr:hypothetical protein BDR06DRAFT_1002236 [Suillus hirtellus]
MQTFRWTRVKLVEVTEIADDVDTAIPSESSILSAKQGRERMRTHGTEDDFISLSVMKRDTMSLDKETMYVKYTSAQERIGLGKKSKKLEASKRKDAMQEMIVDADEEDQETVEWEREQLWRGGPFSTSHEVSPTKQVYKPAATPTSTTIPSLGPAMERLSQSLTAVTTSYTTNVKAAASLVDEREQLESEWVENMATFLDEKLEKLEDDFVLILQECSGMIARRRQADNQDDLFFDFRFTFGGRRSI